MTALMFHQVYKYAAMGYQARQSQVKRLAMLSSMQARRPFTRTAKANKDVQAKAKRLMREMLVFWKKNEREERDVRKREQKEAIDRAKIEEERREAARQARKLEFLISQTELYSHFVGNKLKSTLPRFGDDSNAHPLRTLAAEVQGDTPETSAAPVGADLIDVDPSSLEEIDFDDGWLLYFFLLLRPLMYFLQRIKPTFIVMPVLMHKRQLHLPSNVLNSLIHRLLLSARQMKHSNWQRLRRTFGMMRMKQDLPLLPSWTVSMPTVSTYHVY